MQNKMNDHAYMAEALRLAQQGLYTTRINPRVGCVIVKKGVIIAKGFHAYYGEHHAEIDALNNASDNVENATVYVTLEPCAHTGNTPPCVQSLVQAKISRVVTAMQDPNPLVNGKGIAFLRRHGIETTVNVLEKDARELNKGFVKRVTSGFPYVTIKSAISLDGKTALASGESKWITSEHARLDVQKLRARSCAILTGIKTVLYDDPSLTVRLSAEQLGTRQKLAQPVRVLLDSQLQVSETAKIFHLPGKVLVYTCANDKEKTRSLEAVNAEVITAHALENSVDLEAVMRDLSCRGINEVLVEAGATLVGRLFEQSLVDEMIIYMAPHLLGDSSLGLARLPSVSTMSERIGLEIVASKMVGEEIKITAKPNTH